MKFTTSNHDSVIADVRVHFEFDNIVKERRCFIGLHIDFSMRQILLYLGFGHLFIEIYGPDRSSWGYATIDHTKQIFKFKEWTLQKHGTNHIPDNFFNIGVTLEYYPEEKSIMFFFGKFQLWREFF